MIFIPLSIIAMDVIFLVPYTLLFRISSCYRCEIREIIHVKQAPAMICNSHLKGVHKVC